MRPPPTNGRGAPRIGGTARGLLAVASSVAGGGLLGKRQLEGVAAAKARGAHTGCKATLDLIVSASVSADSPNVPIEFPQVS